MCVCVRVCVCVGVHVHGFGARMCTPVLLDVVQVCRPVVDQRRLTQYCSSTHAPKSVPKASSSTAREPTRSNQYRGYPTAHVRS